MMGLEEPTQNKLFYTDFQLESRVRQNHPLRKIAKVIDFNFAYEAVSECYGKNGNISVPPPVILKLMLLLVFYNVRSERELMSTLPERLDWLWFLGYDLDTSIPDHSILSKARARWGSEIFQLFFENIVFQCVEAGLVDGKKIFIDSSLIDANASKNSIVDRHSLKVQIGKRYKELESRLDEVQEKEKDRPHRIMNNRYISTTDPEAGIFGKGKSTLCYKTHRTVEERSEIITAVEVTAGDINEGQYLQSMLNAHEKNTEIKAETVVADSKYGTIENYIYCSENNINGHMVDLKTKASRKKEKSAKQKIYPDTAFKYDTETDTYICPGNKRLKRKSLHATRSSIDYAASKKDCSSCELRPQCTKNKVSRTVKRHFQQDTINEMRGKASSNKAKSDIKMRQHLMERSFAKAKRYGFDRARWRGLTRVSIQEFLICCVQNIHALIKQQPKPKHIAEIALKAESCQISICNTNIAKKIKNFVEKELQIFFNYFQCQNFYCFLSNTTSNMIVFK